MRIAIIGAGQIGAELAARVGADPRFELVALLSRSGRGVAGVEPARLVRDIEALLAARPALVVEAAAADVSRVHGERLLAVADYVPLSLAALVDDALRGRLERAASTAGTRLLLPHGAIVGLDSLIEWREQWARVCISFRKNPSNIDFSQSGCAVPADTGETLVFAGPVREIARRFPRNVNAMVACALASTGLDRCEARLFSDPRLDRAILEIEAQGHDGSLLAIRRAQPVTGVSGSEMAASLWNSVCRASGIRGGAVDFV